MIDQVWLFHCGYARVPEAALIEGGAPALQKMPFLAMVAFHQTLGPIVIDAPYGHEGPHNVGNLLGTLLRSTAQTFEDDWSIIPRLEQLGYRPSEVNHILMTHLHYDHTGGMKELVHAEFHIARPEWEHASNLGAFGAMRSGYALSDFRALRGRVRTMEVPSYFDPDDPGHDVFGDGSIYALSLPGHARGHIGYRMHLANGQRVVMLGDAIMDRRQLTEDRGFGWIGRAAADSLKRAQTTARELATYRRSNPDDILVCSHDVAWGEACMGGPVSVAKVAGSL